MTAGKAPNFPIRPVLEHYGVHIPSRGKAVCVWHDDSSPSLSVTPNGHGFRCWACGKSGDAIQLIRDEEGCSYQDALATAEALTTGTGRDVSREPDRAGWWGSTSLLG